MVTSYSSRYSALCLFANTFYSWKESLYEKDDDPPHDDDSPNDDENFDLKTLKHFRKTVLQFGVDDNAFMWGINNMLSDESFVHVRAGHSPVRYLSSAVKVWNPSVVEQLLNEGSINNRIVQKYFRTTIPDLEINGILMRDVLLKDKPSQYSVVMENKKLKNRNPKIAHQELLKRSETLILPRIVLPKTYYDNSLPSRSDGKQMQWRTNTKRNDYNRNISIERSVEKLAEMKAKYKLHKRSQTFPTFIKNLKLTLPPINGINTFTPSSNHTINSLSQHHNSSLRISQSLTKIQKNFSHFTSFEENNTDVYDVNKPKFSYQPHKLCYEEDHKEEVVPRMFVQRDKEISRKKNLSVFGCSLSVSDEGFVSNTEVLDLNSSCINSESTEWFSEGEEEEEEEDRITIDSGCLSIEDSSLSDPLHTGQTLEECDKKRINCIIEIPEDGDGYHSSCSTPNEIFVDTRTENVRIEAFEELSHDLVVENHPINDDTESTMSPSTKANVGSTRIVLEASENQQSVPKEINYAMNPSDDVMEKISLQETTDHDVKCKNPEEQKTDKADISYVINDNKTDLNGGKISALNGTMSGVHSVDDDAKNATKASFPHHVEKEQTKINKSNNEKRQKVAPTITREKQVKNKMPQKPPKKTKKNKRLKKQTNIVCSSKTSSQHTTGETPVQQDQRELKEATFEIVNGTPEKVAFLHTAKITSQFTGGTVDEPFQEERAAYVQRSYENVTFIQAKVTVIEERTSRNQSAIDKSESRRLLLEEKRLVKAAERHRLMEEKARSLKLQNELEEELRLKEEEKRLRLIKEEEKETDRRREAQRLAEEEALSRKKLLRKRREEQEEMRRRMSLLIAEREAEKRLKQAKEKLAADIEEELRRKEAEMLKKMSLEQREQYLHNKQIEKQERRMEEEKRQQQLDACKLLAEKERLQKLKELEELREKLLHQYVVDSYRMGNNLLSLAQEISRAFTYSFFQQLPHFVDSSAANSKKRKDSIDNINNMNKLPSLVELMDQLNDND